MRIEPTRLRMASQQRLGCSQEVDRARAYVGLRRRVPTSRRAAHPAAHAPCITDDSVEVSLFQADLKLPRQLP
jgi:hypothetical protein